MLREPDVVSMLLRRRPAYSLAQEFYGDPGVHQVDLHNIWYKASPRDS